MPNVNHMPLYVRSALEWLGASGARTASRLRGLCEHFANTDAYPIDDVFEAYLKDAMAIAAARYGDTFLADA